MKQKNGFVRWIQSGKVNRNLCIFTFMHGTTAPAYCIYLYSIWKNGTVQFL